MTNAQFCDVHPDSQTSLIRGKQNSVTTLVLQTKVQEIGKDGKKITWTRELSLHACATCMKDLIYNRAKALGVDLNPTSEYRLTRDEKGYHRINRSVEEADAEETPLAS